jgi:hypothetical protein
VKSCSKLTKRTKSDLKPAKGHLHMDDARTLSRYHREQSTDERGLATMHPTSFRLSLKRLRNRANVSAKQAALAVGKSESGYMRYEDDRRFDKERIPAPIVMGLLPIMVGRGEPTITQAELLSISEIADITDVLQQTSKPVKGSTREAPELVPSPTQLGIRYQIEGDTYRSAERVQSVTYGVAPILPLRSYPQDKQWCAVVNDDSSGTLGILAGNVLHCVDVSACSDDMLEPGSLVVAFAPNGDLVEVVCGVMLEMGRRGARIRVGKREVADAQVQGVAVYRYGPVQTRPV